MRFGDLADQGKPKPCFTSALGVSAQPIEGLKNEKALVIPVAADDVPLVGPLHWDNCELRVRAKWLELTKN